jgi:hypothetical protein
MLIGIKNTQNRLHHSSECAPQIRVPSNNPEVAEIMLVGFDE